MNLNNYGLDALALLQAYRANPFSLPTDMSRPAQFLPPALGSFDYGAQWNAQNRPPPVVAPAAYAQPVFMPGYSGDTGGTAGDSGAVGSNGGGVDGNGNGSSAGDSGGGGGGGK